METSQPKVTGFDLLLPSVNDGSTWVDDFICLNIISVQEAAKMWGKHEHTIRKAFKEHRLTGADYNGKLIIVTVPSMVRLYGQPKVNVKIQYPAGVINPNDN